MDQHPRRRPYPPLSLGASNPPDSAGAPADPSGSAPPTPPANPTPETPTIHPEVVTDPPITSPKTPDLAAVRVKTEAAIKWKIRDPFLVPDYGDEEAIESMVIETVETLARYVASHMEFDPFMSKKNDMEKNICQCLKRENKAPKREKPSGGLVFMTLFAGVFVGIIWTILFSLIPFFIPLVPIGLKFILSILFLATGIAGFFKINPASKGVLMILGKRVEGIIDEGTYWRFWPFVTFMEVKTHTRQTKLEGDKAFQVIAGNAEDAGKNLPTLNVEIDEKFFEEVVEIISIEFPRMTPENPSIMEARESIEEERALSVRQDIDMRRMRKRVDELLASRKGAMTEEERHAWDIVLSQEELLIRRRYELMGGGKDGGLAGGLLPLAEMLREERTQQNPQNQGGGKGARRNRRHRR